MISIVGNHIYIHEGDTHAFRLACKNSDGDILNFKSTDILLMNIRGREAQIRLLSKTSESLSLGDREFTVLSFKESDYSTLSKGDYFYDLHLETVDGVQYTLIDKGQLHILENPRMIDELDTLPGDEFDPARVVDIDSDDLIHISDATLLCEFNYITIEKEASSSGSLINFDELVEEEIGESNDADDMSLIEF